jgi:transketolase
MEVNRNTIIDNLAGTFVDPRYYLLICDCGFAKTEYLESLYPDRVINCGIMEQATVGIAAGMAQAGLRPIIYSIASFVVFRALEQIRIDIVQQGRNVKIIGNGSGTFFEKLGACHCTYEDDVKVLNAIGMPVYEGSQFEDWLNSKNGGYIRV